MPIIQRMPHHRAQSQRSEVVTVADSSPAQIRGAMALPWRAVCDHATVPLAVLDSQGRYRYANRALHELLGRTGLTGLALCDLMPDAERPTVRETRYVRPDGSTIWLRVTASVLRDGAATPRYVMAEFEDVTAARAAETLWRDTFDRATTAIAVRDVHGRWTNVNDALCRLLGYGRDELIGADGSMLACADGADAAALADLLEQRRETVTVRTCYRHRDGHPLWVSIRSSAIPGPDHTPVAVISQYEESGDERMTDARLAHLALHDPLTGLANRALLDDRLGHQLAQLDQQRAASRRTTGVLAVLMADVDELKPVNDRYGHAAGDRLLKAVARQLRAAVRSGDTVARIGGDEFVVASLVADERAARRLRARVQRYLGTEVELWGSRLRLSVSVGMATTTDAATGTRDLLHDADREMYRDKRRRRRTRQCSTPSGA